MSSAQLDVHPDDELAHHPVSQPPAFELTHPDLSGPALKQQVAERVAAHRARRGQVSPAASSTPESAPRTARTRSAHIAAAVAERYAHSQSYRSFLASEAERAVHQAQAVAQIATINAQAIAVAQQQLLADLENWENTPERPNGPVGIPTVPLAPADYAALFDRDSFSSPISSHEAAIAAPAAAFYSAPSFTVRMHEDPSHPVGAARMVAAGSRRSASPNGEEFDDEERLALDDEIAFRHNPVFEAAFQSEPIAANLIEFPRQLVAPRKARPRIAEGPLRDDELPASDRAQLRIFEVESDHLSSAPAAESLSPVWSSILLSALPTSDFTETPDTAYLPEHIPQAAPVSSRLTAAAIDAVLVIAAQAAFTAVFVSALTHLSGGRPALDIPRPIAIAASAGTLVVLALLYQILFFTLSDATPGMRYARIGLCTFSDENPSRSAMRRRVFATVLAAFPLGLGLLWAFLDEDTLGWHDRISRMYQRSY